MSKILADVGEERIVALISEVFANDQIPLGIGDDAAVVDTLADRAVVAADAMVEGIHFTRDLCPASCVGRKLVAVNLSDLASMGAVAQYATFTASFPSNLTFQWVETLIQGVATESAAHGLVVVGGDVTASPGPVTLSLSLWGKLVGLGPILRSGAQPGDAIYVTGHLGSAALGLKLLQSEPHDRTSAAMAYLQPTPRCSEGQALAEWGLCHAMMDVSDGLYVDAGRMARASGATFQIDLERLPRHPQLAPDQEGFAVHGGEDYELIFTCAEPPPIDAKAIGRVIDGEPGVKWMRGAEVVEPPQGPQFSHFDGK